MGDIDLVNIRTFDLNLLRTLHALLENCNVSAAARQLNLYSLRRAQPSRA